MNCRKDGRKREWYRIFNATQKKGIGSDKNDFKEGEKILKGWKEREVKNNEGGNLNGKSRFFFVLFTKHANCSLSHSCPLCVSHIEIPWNDQSTMPSAKSRCFFSLMSNRFFFFLLSIWSDDGVLRGHRGRLSRGGNKDRFKDNWIIGNVWWKRTFCQTLSRSLSSFNFSKRRVKL